MYSYTSNFRKRFAKLLLALSLIYIGAAIASTQSSGQDITQEFTTVPASSLASDSASSTSDTSVSHSVLGQSTTGVPSGQLSNSPPIFVSQCTYRVIPYKTVYKTASWLNAGQTITTGGFEGEARVCTTQFGPPLTTTLVAPLDKTVTSGTYISSDYSYPGYTNSDGNFVPSPNNSGSIINDYSPTAVCNDGTYSYSQHTSGTCSSHDGVASWL
jgi:hypothetical protein